MDASTPVTPKVKFRERRQVREFAQKYGKNKLEEELDSGLLDLPSTLLAEEWLEDEPKRIEKKNAERRSKMLWGLYIFLLVVVLIAFGYFFASTNQLI